MKAIGYKNLDSSIRGTNLTLRIPGRDYARVARSGWEPLYYRLWQAGLAMSQRERYKCREIPLGEAEVERGVFQ